MSQNPLFGPNQPPDFGKIIRRINRLATGHAATAMGAHHNPAAKLARRDDVQDTFRGLVLSDVEIRGLVSIAEQHNPLFQTDHSIITIADVWRRSYGVLRRQIEKSGLRDELHNLNPVQLQHAVEDALHGHLVGRIWPVRPEGEKHEPKTWWPYLRYAQHLKAHNIRDALNNYRQLRDELKEAADVIDFLDTAAGKTNASLWLSGATLQQVFPGI